jgi:hypothetical protein
MFRQPLPGRKVGRIAGGKFAIQVRVGHGYALCCGSIL